MAMASYGLFRQSLQDLIKGIRANARNENAYVQAKLLEIREESRSADSTTKTNAILKLVHLQMFGYSMAESSFQVVEVLSRPEYAHKRIGYLAAMQSFSPTTDVLLLCTNQLKKDLTSGRMCSQALGCLAKIVTEELGAECSADVARLLSSSRSYIRKKAVLVLYRIGLVYEQCIVAVMPRLRERLSDSDPAVVCVTVTVICELARKNPEKYLSFAPDLYKLLNRSENNWTLIKIVKLMGTLTPLEPRLGKKLVEPLTRLMAKTKAKSLLFECCNTVTIGMTSHQSVVELCAQHLGEFIVDSDQNLKYLGLLALRRIARDCPAIALEHRDLILDCLDDDDVGIRTRALELISEFVSRRNLRDVSRILLAKLRMTAAQTSQYSEISGLEQSDRTTGVDVEAQFQHALEERLLAAGSYSQSADESGFTFLMDTDDFDWYIRTILFGLATTYGLSEAGAETVGKQLLDLAGRVAVVQSAAAECALKLLGGGAYDHDDESGTSGASAIRCQSASLISACCWVVGEYGMFLESPRRVLDALLSVGDGPMSGAWRGRVIVAVLKVYSHGGYDVQDGTTAERLLGWLGEMRVWCEAEVQEQATAGYALVLASRERPEELKVLFDGKLKPVDPRAQSKLPVPEGLDLETCVFELSDVESDEFEGEEDAGGHEGSELGIDFGVAGISGAGSAVDAEEDGVSERYNGGSSEARRADPFYLDGSLMGAGPKRGEDIVAMRRRKARLGSEAVFGRGDKVFPRSSGSSRVLVASNEVPAGVCLSSSSDAEGDVAGGGDGTGARSGGGPVGHRRRGEAVVRRGKKPERGARSDRNRGGHKSVAGAGGRRKGVRGDGNGGGGGSRTAGRSEPEVSLIDVGDAPEAVVSTTGGAGIGTGTLTADDLIG